jgi:DNA polymerase-1
MILAIDTETTGSQFFHGCKPFMVTACSGDHNFIWAAEVDPYNRSNVDWDPSAIHDIQAIIDQADTLVFHNAKFDIRALSTIGIDATCWSKVHDTLIASHVMCSGEPHGLKALAFKYLSYPDDDERELSLAVQRARAANPKYDLAKMGHPTLAGLKSTTKWHKLDMWLCPEECAKYAIGDVERTWLLWAMYERVIRQHKLWPQYMTRRALLKLTYDMEQVGLYLYTEGAGSVLKEIKRLEAYREIFRAAIQDELLLQNHLDLTKDKHIRTFLFEILKLKPVSYTAKTGAPAVDKDAINYYIKAFPASKPLQHFAEYRSAGTKLGYLQSYVKHLASDGRVHTSFLITGTRETRQASVSPNVQNIDKKLRHIFGPPPGKVWVDYDLVNIELRIWTYEVGNQEMIDVFERGESVHELIASIIHPELFARCQKEGTSFKSEYESTWYQWTKNGNFAIIYGASPYRADKTYKKEGCYAKIAKRFPQVPSYSARITEEAEHNDLNSYGPYVTCIGGYRLDIDMEEPFKACNYKIQGSAGYIINRAMILVSENPDYLLSGAIIVNQVHDSIIIELDEEDCTTELMESIKSSIEQAGKEFLPTCTASYKVVKCNLVPNNLSSY